MKKFLVKFLFIFVILLNGSKRSISSEVSEKTCRQFQSKIKWITLDFPKKKFDLRVFNIKNLNEVHFECLDYCESNVTIFSITLYLDKKLVYNNNLNLGLHSNFYSKKIIFFILSNAKAIDLSLDLFALSNNSIQLQYSYSDIKFWTNNSIECSFKQLNESFPIFKKVTYLIFAESCVYTLNTCPLMFKDINVESLLFKGLSFTFIKTNLLSFKTLSENQENLINSTIMNLQIMVYKLNIDNSLFSKNLITRLEYLGIYGVVKSFDKFTFLNLEYLKKLTIYANEFSGLFSNKLDWIFNLDQSLKQNVTIDFIPMDDYTFPDSDFCLYKNLSSLKKVDVFLRPNFNCSCLVVYLLGMDKAQKACPSKFKYFKNCDFTKFSKINCNKTFTVKIHMNFFDQFKLYSTFIDFLSVCFLPLVCILSICTNILNIYILLGSKNSDEAFSKQNNFLYELSLLNSILNLVYSFNYIFHLFNICIIPVAIYCSTYANDLFVQYYEIFIIDYLGYILKSLSNLLDIAISMTRYSMLVKNSFFHKITKLSSFKKKLILVILVIVLGFLNIDKLGNSQVFREYLDFLMGDVALPIRNTFKLNKVNNDINANWYYYINPDESFSSFYVILYILNIFINNVALYVCLLISDLFLMVKFKKNLDSVIEMKKRNFQSNYKKLSQLLNSRVRTVFAIWSNLFILIFLRSLEMVPLVYTIYGEFSVRVCMYGGKSCTAFIQFANVIYVFSCSYKIINYYFLNINFRRKAKSLILTLKGPAVSKF
ncbi:unnamed protein product [Brachionus calyciflorus]|uniref:G-protein coupled receptors family 1 profile domain-containing protein n=1 Tax=Brachionus calyciflorus TaxID=104777 RepID=A0A813SYM9_9BILA|nr:unnamed protein product [Brachionus calyciflorus]